MDQYVRHIKRKPDIALRFSSKANTKNEDDHGFFNLRAVSVVDQTNVTETKRVLGGGQMPPATPQKICLPPLESTTSPPPTPIVHNPIRQNCIRANRRLLFDDIMPASVTLEEKCQVLDNSYGPNKILLYNNKGTDSLLLDDDSQQKVILKKTSDFHILTSTEKEIILLKDEKHFRVIVESLLARGFTVQKLPDESPHKAIRNSKIGPSIETDCIKPHD